jgi:hypothetical protein
VDRTVWSRDAVVQSGDDEILFTMPECPLWGALRIEQNQAGEESSTPERSQPRLTAQSFQ